MEGLYSDTYINVIPSTQRKMKRIAMIILCVVLLILAVVLHNVFVIVVVIVVDGVLMYFLPNMHIAYEYVFVDGQIDFDRIIAGNSRKNMLQTDLDKVDVVAPENSPALDGYKKIDMVDFSSGNAEDKHFVIVYKTEKGKSKVKFTPSEIMLEQMEMKAKSKIARY